MIADADCANHLPPRAFPHPMSQEIEIRFAAPERALKRIAKISALQGFEIGRAATRRLSTVYYDTPELSLSKAGLCLRVRKKGRGFVQTVKDESSGALASERHEYACEIPSAEPDLNRITDEGLRARLQAIAAAVPFAPMIETEILRTTRLVRSPSGDAVELAVDRGEIRTLMNGHAALAVSEIELELKEGAPAALYEVARRLSRKSPLTVKTESKSARGMRALQGEPICAHKAGRTQLPPDCTAEEAFRVTLLHCLRHIARNAPAVAEARLPEGVHQIRVGLRRLRAALSASGGEFRVRALESLDERAKNLSDIFGGTRELDVFATELLTPVEDSTKKPGLAQLRLILEELRRESWEQAVKLVQSDDFTGFLIDLGFAIETRIWRESASHEQLAAFERTARALASETLDKRLKQAGKRAKHLASLNVQERHRLRIALKKLRYSAEFFAPLFAAKPVSAFLERLSKLQDLFGALNDAATVETILRRITEHAGKRSSPELLEAAAFVDGWHHSRVEPTWDKAKKRWKASSKPIRSGKLERNRRHHRHVVGRTQPAARFFQNRVAGDTIAQGARDPDVVEPAAAVGSLPIARAIAPPGIDFLVMRHERPRHIVPVEGIQRRREQFGFDRRMAHHIEQLLVAPDIVLERRHVEIADQHHGIAFLAPLFGEAGLHLAQEIELVGEFRIGLRVGNVAARRDVEIVQLQPGLELGRDMAGIVLAAKGEGMGFAERQARENGDAVIALLAIDRLMDIAEVAEDIPREKRVRNLGLLQAEHVRGIGFQETGDQIGPQTDGIDVPGGDFHGRH